MTKTTTKQLVELFLEEMKRSATLKIYGQQDSNPCHIMFNDIEFYVYLKNLSPAYFSNENIWRAQMTSRDSLESIKDTNALFVLLGYDAECDVYATWNPHFIKQRIGTSSSPSLYSRKNVQCEAANSNTFIRQQLSNDGEVLIFPRNKIVEFMTNIESFFPDTSDYVAMGSKKRTHANFSYKCFADHKNVKGFGEYLLAHGISSDKVQISCEWISNLIKKNYFSRYRKEFLAFDDLSDYDTACENFLNTEEIRQMDQENGNILRPILMHYLKYIQESYSDIEIESAHNNDSKVESVSEESPSDGWENKYIDGHGKLTRIENPELLAKLKPYLHSEYPSMTAALTVIDKYYGDRFPNMEFSDWYKLLNKISWESN
jgi:hypothetical protein